MTDRVAAGQISPHSFEVERALLGACFYSASIARLVAGLESEVFYVEKHRVIQEAIARLAPALNGHPPELALVQANATTHGTPVDAALLAQVLEEGINIVDPDPYIAELRELVAQREEIAVAEMIRGADLSGKRDALLWRDVKARLARAEEWREGASSERIPWTLYDGAEAWKFPPTEFLIEGLIPLLGVMWLGGLPKHCKSLLMLYICLAIACRREQLAGHFAILAHPKILYIAREDSGSRLQDRRDDILRPWGIRPESGAIRFLIKQRIDLLDPVHVGYIRTLCQREQFSMLVLDTWTALSPTADPLGSKEQAALAATVVRLSEDVRGLVVVVDHSRKNRPEGRPLSSADIFGPPQKWAAAEHIVMLDRVANGDRVELFLEGKDTESHRFFLDRRPEGSRAEKFTFAGTVDNLAESSRLEGGTNRERVLLAVTTSPRTVRIEEIVAVLAQAGAGLGLSTVRSHLKTLVALGRVVREGRGRATRYSRPNLPTEEPSRRIDTQAD